MRNMGFGVLIIRIIHFLLTGASFSFSIAYRGWLASIGIEKIQSYRCFVQAKRYKRVVTKIGPNNLHNICPLSSSNAHNTPLAFDSAHILYGMCTH